MASKILLKTLLYGVIISLSFTACKPKSEIGLKDALEGKFLIGTAMNADQITGKDSLGVAVIKMHFNSIVAENIMKSEVIQPVEGEFDFTLSDQFVKFGEENEMNIIGHTLIWHSQAPKWFFVDEKGNDVSREVLIDRMKNHITVVVNRYKGRVNGWDVVNEAVNDDGTMRETPFYKIIGEEYIKLAFQFAYEADPQAELYYNDYSMAKSGKRETVVRIVKQLLAEGVKVTAIGMQGHMTLDYPTVEEYEKSIETFASLGVKVMITEMDMGVLPLPDNKLGAEISHKFEYDAVMNPYVNGLPDSIATKLHDRYASFFGLFLKHKEHISRVTLWGVNDKQSWRNYWPIDGRTDYPLLFDREYKAKPIVETIIKMTAP